MPDEPLLHCDFIFVSDDIAPSVRAIFVDGETQVSDHQPVMLSLDAWRADDANPRALGRARAAGVK